MYLFDQTGWRTITTAVYGGLVASWDVSGYSEVRVVTRVQASAAGRVTQIVYFGLPGGGTEVAREDITLPPVTWGNTTTVILTKTYAVYAPQLQINVVLPTEQMLVNVSVYAACCGSNQPTFKAGLGFLKSLLGRREAVAPGEQRRLGTHIPAELLFPPQPPTNEESR